MIDPLIQRQPAGADLFDRIRDDCRYVAAHAAHVRIRDDRLKEYALALGAPDPAQTLDDGHHFTSRDAEGLAAYIMTLEAVNFGSGFEEALVAEGWPRRDNSIYFTVSTALKEAFIRDGVWDAQRLCRAGVEDMHDLFHLPRARMGQAVAALFASSLNELGMMVSSEYDGRFMNVIDAAGGSAARFIADIGRLDGFADRADYRGREILIFKRAQHLTASLNLAFSRIGRPLFGDADRLTAFADNGIPLVLRVDGVLEADPDLQRRIETGAFLTAGAAEEVELRACAVEAVERLAALRGVKAVEIDYLLWHRSVADPAYKEARPHRTITRFY